VPYCSSAIINASIAGLVTAIRRRGRQVNGDVDQSVVNVSCHVQRSRSLELRAGAVCCSGCTARRVGYSG